MKYLLLVCWNTESMNGQDEPDRRNEPDEFQRGFSWVDDLYDKGIWKMGDQLAPPRRARTVRVRGGKTLVTDGPFVETKEALGGYYLVEAKDLDEAIGIAKDVPAPNGGVEVRPVMVFD